MNKPLKVNAQELIVKLEGTVKKELHKKDLMNLMHGILFENAVAEYKALGIKDDNVLVSKLEAAERKLADFEKLFHAEANV